MAQTWPFVKNSGAATNDLLPLCTTLVSGASLSTSELDMVVRLANLCGIQKIVGVSTELHLGGTTIQVAGDEKFEGRSVIISGNKVVTGGSGELAYMPRPRHSNAVKTTVELDASNRIVLSRELRRAAGIPRRQKLIVSATPGRIVLEMEANTSGHIIKRGKLKLWTGEVPTTPIEEAVNQSRHYTR